MFYSARLKVHNACSISFLGDCSILYNRLLSIKMAIFSAQLNISIQQKYKNNGITTYQQPIV